MVTIKSERDSFIDELLSQEGLSYITGDLDVANESTPSIWLLNDSRPNAKKAAAIKVLSDAGNLFICDSNTARILKSSIRILDPDSIRRDEGGIIELPYNYADYKSASPSVTKEFSFREGAVRERVALKQRSAPREMLIRYIKHALFAKGLPYIHAWYYPDGYRTVFSFKIDVDEFYMQDIENVARWSAEYRDAMTWFVCCSIFKNDPASLKNISGYGLDIQSHGYFHHVYNTSDENLANIKRSIDLLMDNGIQRARGFAGPMGKWNEPLCEALDRAEMEYSSEFGFDYDSLPSFPVFNGGTSDILQIPSHPVCLGLFIEAGITGEATEYFLRIIDAKYSNGEPLILYGHPDKRLGRHKDFFLTVMGAASKLPNTGRMTFGGLNDWWRARRKFKFFQDASDAGMIRTDCRDKRVWYRIETPDGREAFIKAEDCVNIGSARYSTLRGRKNLYEERVMPGTLKGMIKDAIDWEKVTPRGEISTKSAAGMIKYFLRGIRS